MESKPCVLNSELRNGRTENMKTKRNEIKRKKEACIYTPEMAFAKPAQLRRKQIIQVARNSVQDNSNRLGRDD